MFLIRRLKVLEMRRQYQHLGSLSMQLIEIFSPTPSGVNSSHEHVAWQPQYPLDQAQGPQFASPTNGPAVGKVSPHPSQSSRTMRWSTSAGPDNSSPTWQTSGYTPRPELTRPIDYQPPPSATQTSPRCTYDTAAPTLQVQSHLSPEYYEQVEHPDSMYTPTRLLTPSCSRTFGR